MGLALKNYVSLLRKIAKRSIIYSMSQTNSTAIPEICPGCKTLNESANKFCANCGKQLKEITLATNPSKQVIIYLISFFLAPLGLWWAVKYIRSNDTKAKKIGWVCVVLTVISILLSFTVVGAIAGSVNSQLNTNIDQYKELGI